MIVNVIDILSKQGNYIVTQIRQNLAATGTTATGETSRSLRYEVKNEGDKQVLQVIGKPYFMVVETGRKPTPQYKPSYEFVADIRKWASTKGKESFAYAIALSIHQKGTALFRKGGRQDIVSNVINETLIDNISKEMLKQFGDEYLKHAVATFNGNRVN